MILWRVPYEMGSGAVGTIFLYMHPKNEFSLGYISSQKYLKIQLSELHNSQNLQLLISAMFCCTANVRVF